MKKPPFYTKLFFFTVVLSFSAFASKNSIQNCTDAIEEIARRVPNVSLYFNNSRLQTRLGSFDIFPAKKTIDGKKIDGFFLQESGKINTGTVFIPIKGDGPHLIKVNSSSGITLHIAASKTSKG